MTTTTFEQQEVDFDNGLAATAVSAINAGTITPQTATQGIFSILAGQLIDDSFAADALGPDAASLQIMIQAFIGADQSAYARVRVATPDR